MKRVLYILAGALVLAAAGCKDQYTLCEESKTVVYKAGFYNKNGLQDIAVVPSSLTLTFPGISTFIYNRQAGVAALSLSLNPAQDSLKYVIKIADNLPADTMTLVYNTGTQQLTPECGTITIHNFTRVYTTVHTLDSIKITAAPVNNVTRENLRIYY